MSFSLRERILTVTLNRPNKLNAFNEQMEDEVSRLPVDGAADPDFDVAILAGAGRAFSAGGDVEGWMLKNVQQPSRFDTAMSKRMVFALLDFPRRSSRSSTDAIRHGATLALFCDLVFASEKAKIADPHVLMGLCAGDGGGCHLAAADRLCTRTRISADR